MTTIKNKRLIGILGVSTFILLIPFIAMQFTSEVTWTLFDFIVAGILLFGTGFAIEYILTKTTKKTMKIIAIMVILALLLIVWTELAVGIFGTPFAGN